jgi:hypothetical protein
MDIAQAPVDSTLLKEKGSSRLGFIGFPHETTVLKVVN